MAINAVKKAQKQIKAAESDQIRKLRDAGKAELKFLAAEGASKAEIAAERAANKIEVAAAKTAVAASGFQRIPQFDNGLILSDVGTYQNTYAPAIEEKIGIAANLLSEFGIPQLSTKSSGDSTIYTGMSLNNAYALASAMDAGLPVTKESLSQNFGDYVSGANRQAKIFNAVNKFVSDDAITAADFTGKIKPVKGFENVFTSKIGAGTTGTFQFDPTTNTYKMLSATPVRVETDGGFLSSPLGSLLIGIGGSLLVPGLGGFLSTGTWGGLAGTGATLGSSLAAGGLIGAGTSALTGGNILTGGLLGAIGGGAGFGIGQAGGLGNVIKGAGFGISDDLATTLNSLVSGFGAPNQANAQLAADVLTANGIATTADDIIAAGGFTASNQPITMGGYGLTSSNPQIARAVQDAFEGVAFANADEVAQAAINAARAAGQNISLTMPGGMNVLTATPAGLVTQTPFDTFSSTGPNLSASGAPIEERTPEQGVPGTGAQNPNIGPIDAAGGLIGAATGAAGGLGSLAALGAAAAAGRPQQNTGSGRLPAWVTDPAQSKMLTLIPQIQNMQYPNYQVDFNNMFQRGGLGAGQYLGYDLLNMRGDIPVGALATDVAPQTSLV